MMFCWYVHKLGTAETDSFFNLFSDHLCRGDGCAEPLEPQGQKKPRPRLGTIHQSRLVTLLKFTYLPRPFFPKLFCMGNLEEIGTLLSSLLAKNIFTTVLK
jgi:hypothetical protein